MEGHMYFHKHCVLMWYTGVIYLWRNHTSDKKHCERFKSSQGRNCKNHSSFSRKLWAREVERWALGLEQPWTPALAEAATANTALAVTSLAAVMRETFVVDMTDISVTRLVMSRTSGKLCNWSCCYTELWNHSRNLQVETGICYMTSSSFFWSSRIRTL